jgi:hypothetical protein
MTFVLYQSRVVGGFVAKIVIEILIMVKKLIFGLNWRYGVILVNPGNETLMNVNLGFCCKLFQLDWLVLKGGLGLDYALSSKFSSYNIFI